MPSLRTVAVGAVVALGAVATTLVLVDRGGVPSLLDTSGCTAEVDGHTVQIDLEQAENAALVTAGTKVTVLPGGEQVKALELSGVPGLLFRRNSVSGAVEVIARDGRGVELNEALH